MERAKWESEGNSIVRVYIISQSQQTGYNTFDQMKTIGNRVQSTTDLLSIASLCHQGKSHGVWRCLSISLGGVFGGGSGIPLGSTYGQRHIEHCFALELS
jgi:hypothetical protein